MLFKELQNLNNTGTAVVNTIYSAVDSDGIMRFFKGISGGRLKEIDDPNSPISISNIDPVSSNVVLGHDNTPAGPVQELVLGPNLDATGGTLNVVGVTTSPAGVDTDIQFNQAGAFGASTGVFVWDYNTFKLGIGLTAPQSTIHVQSPGGVFSGVLIESTDANQYATSDWMNDQGDLAQMAFTGSSFNNGIFTPRRALFNTSSPGGMCFVAYDAGGEIIFATAGYTEPDEKMKIDSSGNVGINTYGIGQNNKLEVNSGVADSGGIRLTQLTNTSQALRHIQPIGVDANGDIYLTDFIQGRYLETQFNLTTNTAFTDVTDLTISIVSDSHGPYPFSFRAELFVFADTIGGLGACINTASTTINDILYETRILDNTTSSYVVSKYQGTLGTGTSIATGNKNFWVIMTGTLLCSTEDITIQFKQSLANGTSSILVGSYFKIEPLQIKP